jgi:hypothetical protein
MGVAFTIACTLCDSAAARQLRAGFFEDNIALSLLATAAPFAAVAAVIAWVHFGSPLPRRRHGRDRR